MVLLPILPPQKAKHNSPNTSVVWLRSCKVQWKHWTCDWAVDSGALCCWHFDANKLFVMHELPGLHDLPLPCSTCSSRAISVLMTLNIRVSDAVRRHVGILSKTKEVEWLVTCDLWLVTLVSVRAIPTCNNKYIGNNKAYSMLGTTIPAWQHHIPSALWS